MTRLAQACPVASQGRLVVCRSPANEKGTRVEVMVSTTGVTVRPLRDDRFLVGILAGIGLLLVLALAAIIFLRGSAQELPGTTPGGTVQRFLQALERQEYDQAYDYLGATMSDKPSRDEFARYNANSMATEPMDTRLRIERESISSDTAIVVVEATHYSTGSPLFGGGEWTSSETFTLRREGGMWLITSLPYRYWPPQGKW